MSNQRLLSIIFPVYNQSKNLDTLFKSLVNFKDDEKVEFIFVDDHSKDDSVLKLQSLFNLWNNYRLVRKQTNTGVSDTRNIGMSQSSAKWIVFVDPDDYFLPSGLNIILNQIITASDTDYFYTFNMKTKSGKLSGFSEYGSILPDKILNGGIYHRSKNSINVIRRKNLSSRTKWYWTNLDFLFYRSVMLQNSDLSIYSSREVVAMYRDDLEDGLSKKRRIFAHRLANARPKFCAVREFYQIYGEFYRRRDQRYQIFASIFFDLMLLERKYVKDKIIRNIVSSGSFYERFVLLIPKFIRVSMMKAILK